MDYRSAANRLRRNIQIMENTFANNNLQVLNIGCKPCDDEDGDVFVYVELSTIKGTRIPGNIKLKVNLYDIEGNLYLSSDTWIIAEEFCEYDTYSILCEDSTHALEYAVSGRLFASRV